MSTQLPDRLSTGDALDDAWLATTAATCIDVVVGNPPYVRFQELPQATRRRLSDGSWRTTGEGTYNLYFAFFEIGWKLLKPTGRLGYITPNAHFATRAARGLRAYLTDRQGLDEIIDCGNVSIFPDAATYPAITYLSRTPTPTFTFGRLEL